MRYQSTINIPAGPGPSHFERLQPGQWISIDGEPASRYVGLTPRAKTVVIERTRKPGALTKLRRYATQ